MSLTDPKLVISSEQMDKVRYFLKTFKTVEWSGPAWYSHVKDENGFPSIIKLEYWHPLDLGTAGNTDWDGENLMKIYSKLRKKYPKIGKQWVQGNIHSHHGMGAFFSGTDEQQCIDGANENFYYSLVVSHKVGKELHFGVSYPDQFGQIHILEIDDIEVEQETTFDNEWKKQANIIKKNKKPEHSMGLYKYNRTGNNYQSTLFDHYKEEKKPTKDERYMEYIDDLSFQGSFGVHDNIDKIFTRELFDEIDEINRAYEKQEISKYAMQTRLKKLGVDENGRPLP